MNTVIKLEKALSKRKLTMQISMQNDGTWAVVVDGDGRTTATTSNGASLESTIDEVLRRWDADKPGDVRATTIEALKAQNDSTEHGSLPGHEHCGQLHCATCRAPFDSDQGGWLLCERLTCLACYEEEQQAARHEKHPTQYFLDQDYPVTIYETLDPDDHGFVAECRDLPGTTVEEDTVADAYERAKEAAKLWIETAAACGQRIPLPTPPPEDRFKFKRERPEQFDD